MGGMVDIAKDLLKNEIISYQYGFRKKSVNSAFPEEEYFFQTYGSYSCQMRDLRVQKLDDGKVFYYIFFF